MSSERTLLIITTTTKSEEKKSQNYYHHKFTISIQENFPREFVHLWWQSQMTTNSKISKRIWKFVVITNSQIQLGIWKMRPPDGKSCSAVNYKPSFFGLLLYIQHCSYIFNTAAISSTLLYIFNTAAAISSTSTSTVFAAICLSNKYKQECE